MSTSKEDAKIEREYEIDEALNTRDSEGAYQLANQLKEEGDDELAEKLQTLAKKWDGENDAYDNERDNQN